MSKIKRPVIKAGHFYSCPDCMTVMTVVREARGQDLVVWGCPNEKCPVKVVMISTRASADK